MTLKIYKALKVKNTDSNNWMALTEIEGFNYDTGYEYELIVKKIIQAEPYAVRYVLIETVSKKKKN